MAEEERITEDQANEALMQLAQIDEGADEVVEEQPAAEEEVVEAAPAEEAAEVVEEGGEPAEPVEAEPSEPKAAPDDSEARMDGMRTRYAENERILRDRFLQKSTAADKALKVLEASLGDEGVSREEAQRVISELKGTMNPESATYTPPAPQAPGQPADREDQALVINSFLNEHGMTADEATEFGNWVRTEAQSVLTPAERAVGERGELDGFLRLAHNRWNTGKVAQARGARRDVTVAAVRTVQNTQRRAAKAAAAQGSAPRKQPPTPKRTPDVTKLTKNDISQLLRDSVEQHR